MNQIRDSNSSSSSMKKQNSYSNSTNIATTKRAIPVQAQNNENNQVKNQDVAYLMSVQEKRAAQLEEQVRQQHKTIGKLYELLHYQSEQISSLQKQLTVVSVTNSSSIPTQTQTPTTTTVIPKQQTIMSASLPLASQYKSPKKWMKTIRKENVDVDAISHISEHFLYILNEIFHVGNVEDFNTIDAFAMTTMARDAINNSNINNNNNNNNDQQHLFIRQPLSRYLSFVVLLAPSLMSSNSSSSSSSSSSPSTQHHHLHRNPPSLFIFPDEFVNTMCIDFYNFIVTKLQLSAILLCDEMNIDLIDGHEEATYVITTEDIFSRYYSDYNLNSNNNNNFEYRRSSSSPQSRRIVSKRQWLRVFFIEIDRFLPLTNPRSYISKFMKSLHESANTPFTITSSSMSVSNIETLCSSHLSFLSKASNNNGSTSMFEGDEIGRNNGTGCSLMILLHDLIQCKIEIQTAPIHDNLRNMFDFIRNNVISYDGSCKRVIIYCEDKICLTASRYFGNVPYISSKTNHIDLHDIVENWKNQVQSHHDHHPNILIVNNISRLYFGDMKTLSLSEKEEDDDDDDDDGIMLIHMSPPSQTRLNDYVKQLSNITVNNNNTGNKNNRTKRDIIILSASEPMPKYLSSRKQLLIEIGEIFI